jgi:hypothetical protein
MPPPRFQHGYKHDVFLSYTHTDNQEAAGLRWVSEFTRQLHARLEIVSGHSIDLWRDEEKLGGADRFNETIASAVRNSAVLLVVLSPSYFNSEPCQNERAEFYAQAKRHGKECVAGKARVVKAAKFWVPLDKYPDDLRALLEYKFYAEIPLGSGRHKEFYLAEDQQIRDRHPALVDDVAQEIACILAGLEPVTAPAKSQGMIYVAETTSDVESHRDDLRRRLTQLGYEVEPKKELRLLPAREIRNFVAETIQECCLAIHPVGAYFGFVPEGADGKSVVQMQIELAQMDCRNGNLGRIIWVPEGLVPQEETQKSFLERLRTDYAGRGFEFLERPFRALATCVEDRLKAPSRQSRVAGMPPPDVYVVCDNSDRALAKNIRFFLYSQGRRVEVTPASLAQVDLTGDPEHEKLLQRNRAHLVLHGETSDGWIQDRIRELDDLRAAGRSAVQAIYLANPRREDKDDILVRDIALLPGYSPLTIADALKPFLEQTGVSGPPPSAGGMVVHPVGGHW